MQKERARVHVRSRAQQPASLPDSSPPAATHAHNSAFLPQLQGLVERGGTGADALKPNPIPESLFGFAWMDAGSHALLRCSEINKQCTIQINCRWIGVHI
eukprot:365573-Chlamydomonas_euryale.AAC.6